jgi:hypothetical protein
MDFYLSISHGEITRESYTLLDFIGDIGALFDALIQIFAFALFNVLSFGVLLENSILEGVFRVRRAT